MTARVALLGLIEPLAMAPSRAVPVAAAPSLCRAGERVMFECDTGKRLVAVCAGPTAAQYRSGRPGRIDLASPARSGGLSYANRAYSGGGETQVTFVNGRYAYTVYSSVIRTAFGADGRNDPAFLSGIIVSKDGAIVSARKCRAPSDAVLDLGLAQQRLNEGAFVDHD